MKTEDINKLKNMGAFVDMLIDEGVKKEVPFYINLKNRETEKKKKIKTLF